MVKKISSKKLYLDLLDLFKKYNYISKNEAMLLLCHICGLKKEHILLDDVTVDEQVAQKLMQLANKRISGYPLQYLLGEWEFYGNTFLVGEGVLIPRQDTETLVEAVIEHAQKLNSPKIIDLCSGSGCIGITLAKALKKRNPKIFLLEKSQNALEYINKNVLLNNTECVAVEDDVLNPKTSESEFDIIVSNPPYLTSEDMKNLQREVSFEPKMALDAMSQDGLLFYEQIARIWKSRLKSGGIMAFEVGINQCCAVENIFKANGYNFICHRSDLCGIIRVVTASK